MKQEALLEITLARTERAKDRRDRFAMAALTGIIAAGSKYLDAVESAANWADAMITELDRRDNGK